MRRLLLLGVAGLGCATASPPPATQFSLQLASGPAIVTGRVLAIYPDTTGRGTPIVLVDSAGRPYHLLVVRHTRAGMTMGLGSGNRVTAWWHAAGADSVADSVRVEPGP